MAGGLLLGGQATWGFSCYVDAEDEGLRRAQGPRELADRIRENLRTCRCLIYAFSSASVQSKWMPWELLRRPSFS